MPKKKPCRRCGFDCNDTCRPLCAICDNEILFGMAYDERGYPCCVECLEEESEDA